LLLKIVSAGIKGIKYDYANKITKYHFAISTNDSIRLTSAFEEALRHHEISGLPSLTRKDIKPLFKILLQSEQLTLQAFRLIKQATAKKTFIYNIEHEIYKSTSTYNEDKSIVNVIDGGVIRFIRSLR
jgi:hypothetical protein